MMGCCVLGCKRNIYVSCAATLWIHLTSNQASVLSNSEFSKNVFDWQKRGFTPWNTVIDRQCKFFWTIQQYYVNEEYLSRSREDRLAARARDLDHLLPAGAVWVTGIDKQLERISVQEKDIAKDLVFTEQACMDGMGQHYYYNMTKSTRCVADQMYPWFPITMNGELIATGFLTIGQLDVSENSRNWFERPTEDIVKAIVPKGPDCIYEHVAISGAVTMHIYYIYIPALDNIMQS